MGYGVDLSRIRVLRYMEMLKNQNLLPGRRILLKNIEENFRGLADAGIENLAELKSQMSTKPKLSALAKKTGVPEDYLIILKREMGSLEQKPVPISDFPGIPADAIAVLHSQGIKTSKDVLGLTADPGIDEDILRELHTLCDLVRINGVGAAAARTLYKGGCISVADIANADAEKLLEGMNAANVDKRYYKANLGTKDVRFIIDAAKMLVEQE